MTKIVSRNWKSYFKALKEYKNLDKNLMVFVARSLRKRNPKDSVQSVVGVGQQYKYYVIIE